MPHNNLKQIYAISYKENISVQNTLNISYKEYLKITKKKYRKLYIYNHNSKKQKFIWLLDESQNILKITGKSSAKENTLFHQNNFEIH